MSDASTPIPTTDAERFVITDWRAELDRRRAWLDGYAQGAGYITTAMLRARGITGKYKISDDATELVKVDE